MEPHEAENEPQQIASVLDKNTTLNPRSHSEYADEREQKRRIRLRSSVWDELCKARGPRYTGNLLENYIVSCPEQQTAVDSLRDYALDFEANFQAGKSILLLGPVGTGKDHLMFAMARAAALNFCTVLWVNGADLWMAYRQSYNCDRMGSDLVSYGEVLCPDLYGRESCVTKKLATVDVLCISDPVPPSGPLTDSQAEKLIQIVDRRYSFLLPTFMTVNVANRLEAEQRMGAAVVDRLGHGALAICCNWDSFRKAKPE
jgi:DNA replication protein DnaC